MQIALLDAVVLLTLGLVRNSCAQQDWGNFWHVTDFHYGFTYHDCQLSCNMDHRPSDSGKYGDVWCDSPWALVDSTLTEMARMYYWPDFILWTGDSVFRGNDSDLRLDIKVEIIANITVAIKAKFPRTPVYAMLGNQDYFPRDQFTPHNNDLYNSTLELWADWIGDASAYYTVKTQHGLRIIALNTYLYYTSNTATIDITDPADQLVWLEETLYYARTNQEKVLVFGHVPRGVHASGGNVWMHEKFHAPLVLLLRRYADIIVGMHFGHDHTDSFKILDNEKGEPAVPIFIAPSVTPNRYLEPGVILPPHNPGIQLFRYNRTTGIHLTLTQWYMDLSEANSLGLDKIYLECSL